VPRRPTASLAARVPVAARGEAQTYVGAHEVTVGRFRACVQAGACAPEHFATEHGAPCNWAVDGHDAHPMNCVDWLGAQEFCTFDGGRLCTADEWFTACRGPSDLDYPYGPAFDPDACHARSGIAAMAVGTEPVGSRPTCSGGTPGAHDFAGNVSEWVDECNGTYCHMYGGAYVTNEPVEMFASCKHVCAGNQKTFLSSSVGIRCCYDSAAR
jgi:formylglycine-generating enzyme required for sulfatase activity